jgi:hypothetical protein
LVHRKQDAAMSHRRNRAKQSMTFTERLLKAAAQARQKAESLEPGTARDALLEKAREFEGQLEMNSFLQPPGIG